MSRLSIKRVIPAAILSLLLIAPVPVLAAVNPDVQSAASAGIQYLANNQNGDGSISGFGGESEWSVEAIVADGQDPSTFSHNGSPSLVDFLQTDVPGPTAPTTTLERNIIAIAAAGQDTSSFGGVDYDALLEAQHVDSQIGDPTLLNDDIFGIIAADATHDSQLESTAQDGLNYLLAHQGADGGFSYLADDSCAGCGSDNNDTAAAIIAMYAAQDMGLTAGNLATAETNALTYLLSTQQTDGGFAYDTASPSDGDSTAWSLMALNTIGDSVSAQALLARNWLLQNQNPDGGFSYGAYGTTDSDTYTTANVVTALLGTTWLLKPSPISPVSQQTTTGQPAATTTAETTDTGSSPAQNPQTIATQPPAEVTTSSSPAPASTPPNNTPAQANTPQVKADTTVRSSSKTPVTIAKTADKTHSRAIYGAALLALVALIWFMLESRQARKAKNVD